MKIWRLENFPICGSLSFFCDSQPDLEANCTWFFCIVNLLRVFVENHRILISCLWQRSGIDDPQGCILLFPLVRRDCWSSWVWKFRSQYVGCQLVFWRPVLPVRGMCFLIIVLLPLTRLELQHDRPTGKSLKFWRNWRPRFLKTRIFDGLASKSSCS
jgi:hypothetical protein